MDKKLLGEQIRIARKQLGITGEKLAEKCNIDPSYLRQIECGSKMPSLPTFIILCRELKTSPSTLLSTILPDPPRPELSPYTAFLRTLTPTQIDLLKTLLQTAAEALND